MNMGSFSSFFAASVLRWFFSTYLEASSQHSGRRLEQCSVCALAPHGVDAFFALQVTTCAWRSCWKKRFSTRPRATPSARSTAQCKDPQLRSAAQKRQNLQAHQTLPPPASLLCRIHDNEGAAEMLIDTLGPEIVNAEDGKNRWDVYRNKKKHRWVKLDVKVQERPCDVVSAGHLYTRPPSPTTWSVCSCC